MRIKILVQTEMICTILKILATALKLESEAYGGNVHIFRIVEHQPKIKQQHF